MQKLIDLLQIFKDRSVDPALRGHTCLTQEAFELARAELALALHETLQEREPPNLIAHIPPKVLALVHHALHFNANTDDCWEALACAAIDIQTGPS